jgi:hypothetical protein
MNHDTHGVPKRKGSLYENHGYERVVEPRDKIGVVQTFEIEYYVRHT